MIAGSKFVIGHNSTALQYAILFKKPILLITTKEIKKLIKYTNIFLILKILLDVNIYL